MLKRFQNVERCLPGYDSKMIGISIYAYLGWKVECSLYGCLSRGICKLESTHECW